MANVIRDDDDDVEYNYDFNGDEDEESNEDGYSSSEEVNHFVSQRRKGYRTFDNDDEEQPISTADDAIYGVFLSTEDEDKKKWRRSRHFNKDAVSFVPSQMEKQKVESEQKEESEEKVDKDVNTQKDDDVEEDLEMKKANDHFHTLLERSQRKKKPNRSVESSPKKEEKIDSFDYLPEQFGNPGLGFGKKESIGKKIDPTLGTWEKHTKGIGMKLLSKMGYSGSGGLGSKKRKGKAKEGISRPVQVVVRPTNLGLGFGSFREASQLATNRLIESQVLGKEPPKESKQQQTIDYDSSKFGTTSIQSDLPTTSHLLKQSPWRKKRKITSSVEAQKKKKHKPVFVSYQDLMKQKDEDNKDQTVIIDLRGPACSTKQNDTAPTIKSIPLGEELLYNVTFVLQSTQNKLFTAASTQKSIESKQKESYEKLVKNQQLCEEIFKREKKLLELSEILNKISQTKSVENVIAMIKRMGQGLTMEEIKTLNFYQFWVPCILGSSLLFIVFPTWQPLSSDSDQKNVLSTIFEHCHDCCPHDNHDGARESLANEIKTKIMMNYVIPHVKRSFQTWNPIENAESASNLYRRLRDKVIETSSKSSKNGDDDTYPENTEDGVFESNHNFSNVPNDGKKDLISMLEDKILHGVIFMKLQTTLKNWKPNCELQGKEVIWENPLDSWLLPWLIWFYSANRQENHNKLLNEIDHKLKQGLKQLSLQMKNDYQSFFEGCLLLYKPWMSIINLTTSAASTNDGRKSMSSIISPRVGKYLSRIKVQIPVQNQDWTFLDVLVQLYQYEILTDLEYLCFIEGEVLPNWYQTLYETIQTQVRSSSDDNSQKDQWALYYVEWKRRLLLPPPTDSIQKTSHSAPKTPPWKVLNADPIICRYFYGGLRLLEDASTNKVKSEDTCAVCRNQSNYHQAQLRRLQETLLKEKEREMRGTTSFYEGKDVAQRTHVMMKNSVTFRQVLEHVTRQQNISFYPKANAFIDGKQIYILAAENSSPMQHRSIYIDSNVIYAKKESTTNGKRTEKWQPVSMEDLLSSI